jgi:hypothetical protein
MLYERIEKIWPEARKIELYATTSSTRWTVWGDEVR